MPPRKRFRRLELHMPSGQGRETGKARQVQK